MSSLLNKTAVSRQKGENAAELLQAYIQTGPEMAQNHALAASKETRPKGTGMGDQFEPV
jgi:hypothetical protein